MKHGHFTMTMDFSDEQTKCFWNNLRYKFQTIASFPKNNIKN